MANTSENLKPLLSFYKSSDLDLPAIHELSGDDLPEPYKHLLVHDSDMTPRLTEFFNGEISLNVLDSLITEDAYQRKVVLVNTEPNEPVEFGAICIHLSRFEEHVKRVIADGKIPLGTILANWNINHSSKPNMYFSIESDRWISEYLYTEIGQLLYGRCNTITNKEGESLADIVEILPVIF